MVVGEANDVDRTLLLPLGHSHPLRPPNQGLVRVCKQDGGSGSCKSWVGVEPRTHTPSAHWLSLVGVKLG